VERKGQSAIVRSQSMRSTSVRHHSIFNICNVSIELENVVTFSNEAYIVFAALEANFLEFAIIEFSPTLKTLDFLKQSENLQ
jgi:hypothetical protein